MIRRSNQPVAADASSIKYDVTAGPWFNRLASNKTASHLLTYRLFQYPYVEGDRPVASNSIGVGLAARLVGRFRSQMPEKRPTSRAAKLAKSYTIFGEAPLFR